MRGLVWNLRYIDSAFPSAYQRVCLQNHTFSFLCEIFEMGHASRMAFSQEQQKLDLYNYGKKELFKAKNGV